MRAIPRPAEVLREAIVVIGGAVLAAWIIGKFPKAKAWMKEQWQ